MFEDTLHLLLTFQLEDVFSLEHTQKGKGPQCSAAVHALSCADAFDVASLEAADGQFTFTFEDLVGANLFFLFKLFAGLPLC